MRECCRVEFQYLYCGAVGTYNFTTHSIWMGYTYVGNKCLHCQNLRHATWRALTGPHSPSFPGCTNTVVLPRLVQDGNSPLS